MLVIVFDMRRLEADDVPPENRPDFVEGSANVAASATFHALRKALSANYCLGTTGVGVLLGKRGVHFCSFAARMSRTEAPDENICIASRATSMQMPHVMPCGSHLVTSPFAARAVTKQSSLPRCPLRSQPQ